MTKMILLNIEMIPLMKIEIIILKEKLLIIIMKDQGIILLEEDMKNIHL